MKISISISPKEVSTLANDLNIDVNKLLETFSRFAVNTEFGESNPDIPNNYSLEMLYEWFEKISWQTFYFGHLIAVHSKELNQHDAHGYYLDSEQLSKFDISERSAASRVGGSRRVCKTINSIDILFIRTQSKEKRKKFYISIDAIDDLLSIAEESDAEYREELKGMGTKHPTD